MTPYGAQLLEQFVKEHGHGPHMELVSATTAQIWSLLEADENYLRMQMQVEREAEICRDVVREKQRSQQ